MSSLTDLIVNVPSVNQLSNWSRSFGSIRMARRRGRIRTGTEPGKKSVDSLIVTLAEPLPSEPPLALVVTASQCLRFGVHNRTLYPYCARVWCEIATSATMSWVFFWPAWRSFLQCQVAKPASRRLALVSESSRPSPGFPSLGTGATGRPPAAARDRRNRL
jgi:hypothetical protein